MRIFLAIKYEANMSNRLLIENISDHLTSFGHQVFVAVRDLEQWGKRHLDAIDLMRESFELIDSCEILLVEFSQKGVGVGIEAGYAWAKKIPIISLVPQHNELSVTLKGISREVIKYSNVSEIRI